MVVVLVVDVEVVDSGSLVATDVVVGAGGWLLVVGALVAPTCVVPGDASVHATTTITNAIANTALTAKR